LQIFDEKQLTNHDTLTIVHCVW